MGGKLAQWEYMVIVMNENGNVMLDGGSKGISDALNRLGQDEWELVSTSNSPIRDNETLLYLKRKERRSIF